MIVCDQRGCTARATREVWFDNGGELWFCSHHASQHFPWIERDLRFTDKPTVIVT